MRYPVHALHVLNTHPCIHTHVRVCTPAQGAEWLSKEKARVEKLLSTGSVESKKVDEISRKASVLGHILKADE